MIKKLVGNKVALNFSYLAIGNILAQFLNLFILILIARKVSTAEYGELSFLIIQGMLLASLVDFGTRNIIIRTIARDKNLSRDLLINGITFRAILAIMFGLFYFFYNHYFGDLNLNEIISLVIFTCVFSIGILIDSIFYAYEKMLPTSLANIVINLSWFLMVILIPDDLFNSSILFYLLVASHLIKPIVLLFFLYHYKYILGDLNNFVSSTKKILIESWPYIITMILMLPVNYLSSNFLDVFSNKIEVGYLNVAQKITSPVFLITGFALSAIFPNLSTLWIQDKTKFQNKLVVGVKYFMILSGILSFSFTLFAPEILTILFTEKFENAILISQTQIWFVLLIGVNSLIGTIWGASNKEKLLIKTTIINAIIATPILLFSSYHGALSLSYGYLISFALFEIYIWITFLKTVKLPKYYGINYWMFIVALFLSSYFIFDSTDFMIRFIFFTICMVLFYFIFVSKKFRFSKHQL